MNVKDRSQLFLRKASDDEILLKHHLNDDLIANSIWGFHAQQAAEKILKAVIVYKGLQAPRSHDMTGLYEILESSGNRPPVSLEALDLLTPFAVTFRYDDVIEDELDKQAAWLVICHLNAWAQTIVIGV